MVLVNTNAVSNSHGTLWGPVFKAHLANLRAGKNIGATLGAVREITETVPGFDESEIKTALKDCKPMQDFDALRRKIESGELSLIGRARKSQKKYGFDEAALANSIFHGVNEKLLTFRLYIGAGNLRYVSKAWRLIEEHGDIERYPGEGTRSELLAKATTRGIKTAEIKAEIAADVKK